MKYDKHKILATILGMLSGVIFGLFFFNKFVLGISLAFILAGFIGLILSVWVCMLVAFLYYIIITIFVEKDFTKGIDKNNKM